MIADSAGTPAPHPGAGSAPAAAADAVHAEEAARLAAVLVRLERKIAGLTAIVESHEADFRGVQAYMAENHGSIDPDELYQNELMLIDADMQGSNAVQARARLEAVRSTPYFGRLDFAADGGGEEDAARGGATGGQYYIGRQSVQDSEGVAVVDWRSPLGGLYYESEPGPASYTAPTGPISGRITLKRQLKVEGGRLRFAVDTADALRDEILLEEIGRTTDAHMRSIISSIQREQNAIIRNESDATLIIQGVAGSGKTSIALHRIAYLLFRRRATLSAENTAIISPNGLFAEYVSDVLPELGEEPVEALDLEGIARTRLAPLRMGFTPPADPVEPDGAPPAARARARALSTAQFRTWLEHAAAEAVRDCFEPQDLRIKWFRVEAAELRERYAAMPSIPVTKRLREIAEYLCGRARLEDPSAAFHPKPGQVAKELNRMLTVKSAKALYASLFRRDDAPEAVRGRWRPPAAATLEWPDVYPFLLVADYYTGLERYGHIRHLVIDEMQDHTPVQYAVLQRLFRCDMTILGDVGQALGATEGYTAERLGGLFPGARVMELNRSYRSTAEIMRFAGQVRGAAVEAVDRHGPEPEVRPYPDAAAEVRGIAAEIGRFRAHRSGRLAVVAKSRARAAALHAQLAQLCDGVALAEADARGVLSNDAVVVPVSLAKGLEFDEVIAAEAAADVYSPGDRGLLYIACTRALHRLTATHAGPPSPLLPG
ncbi:HelD family protein [Nocardiopsis coralliicola]